MELSVLQQPVDLSAGEWIKDIPDCGDLELKVRSIHYKPFKVANAALGRKSGDKLQTDEGTVEFTVDVGGPVAEHIVTDWRNLPITDKGVPLPYSKENARAVFMLDDSYGEGNRLRAAAQWAAQRVADGLKKKAQEAAGN